MIFTSILYFNYDNYLSTRIKMAIIRISIPECSAKRISIRIYSGTAAKRGKKISEAMRLNGSATSPRACGLIRSG
jgi:hypothetical protein